MPHFAFESWFSASHTCWNSWFGLNLEQFSMLLPKSWILRFGIWLHCRFCCWNIRNSGCWLLKSSIWSFPWCSCRDLEFWDYTGCLLKYQEFRLLITESSIRSIWSCSWCFSPNLEFWDLGFDYIRDFSTGCLIKLYIYISGKILLRSGDIYGSWDLRIGVFFCYIVTLIMGI